MKLFYSLIIEQVLHHLLVTIWRAIRFDDTYHLGAFFYQLVTFDLQAAFSEHAFEFFESGGIDMANDFVRANFMDIVDPIFDAREEP